MHRRTRIFRTVSPAKLQRSLRGAVLEKSFANGKQMLFRFSGGSWLGIHLGMSGRLSVGPAEQAPAKHDHLVLHQAERSLIFSDPRQFGLVLFHQGEMPSWWTGLAPSVLAPTFTRKHVGELLGRHRTLPLKAALLRQDVFPGVGNWMADEILWQARLHPRLRASELNARQLQMLWAKTRAVCAGALRTVGKDFSDPPRGWLFHRRWSRGGTCSRDGQPLRYEEVGGRTTVWCPVCQRR